MYIMANRENGKFSNRIIACINMVVFRIMMKRETGDFQSILNCTDAGDFQSVFWPLVFIASI